MQGGSCEVFHARWVTQGGIHKVGYARYESPSEIFHSLIFIHFI